MEEMMRGGEMATTAASLKCLSVSNAAQIRFRSVSYPLAGDSFLLTLAFYAPNSMKKPALQAKDLASYSRTQLVFVSAGFWQQWHSYILFFFSLSLFIHILVCLHGTVYCTIAYCNDIWRFPWLSQEVAARRSLPPSVDAVMHVKTAQEAQQWFHYDCWCMCTV